MSRVRPIINTAYVWLFIHVLFQIIFIKPILEIEGIRLAGSSVSHRGRVEILYGGEYGTICDTTFDAAAARVVCKMLGFVDGSAVSAAGPFGKGMQNWRHCYSN